MGTSVNSLAFLFFPFPIPQFPKAQEKDTHGVQVCGTTTACAFGPPSAFNFMKSGLRRLKFHEISFHLKFQSARTGIGTTTNFRRARPNHRRTPWLLPEAHTVCCQRLKMYYSGMEPPQRSHLCIERYPQSQRVCAVVVECGTIRPAVPTDSRLVERVGRLCHHLLPDYLGCTLPARLLAVWG